MGASLNVPVSLSAVSQPNMNPGAKKRQPPGVVCI